MIYCYSVTILLYNADNEKKQTKKQNTTRKLFLFLFYLSYYLRLIFKFRCYFKWVFSATASSLLLLLLFIWHFYSKSGCNGSDTSPALTMGTDRLVLPLTRRVFLVLLQDPEPLVLAVVGNGGSAVSPGAVVVQHPPALPLQRGEAGPGSRGDIQHAEAESRRPCSGQEHEQQSVHGVWINLSPVNRCSCCCCCL